MVGGGAPESVIGKDDPNSDYTLQPEKHADMLLPEAGAFARILRSDALRAIMARYTMHDARAKQAQAVYKKLSRIAIYARLGAVLVGALFLLPLDTSADAGRSALTIGTALQYVFLGIALIVTAWIGARRSFSRWMEARAEAELARLALFDTVMATSETLGDGELPLLPLKLEYLRRYQLDVQTRYYGQRGAEHQAAAGQNQRYVLLLQILGGLAFAAFLAVGASWIGWLPLPLDGLHYLLLAIGTMVSGLFGTLAAISSMNLDERNAARYLVVHDNLKTLGEESLAWAREAAARGDERTVKEFAKSIERLISSEHQEWLELKRYVQKPEDLVGVALDPVRIAVPTPSGR
jgi:hypothetical protein